VKRSCQFAQIAELFSFQNGGNEEYRVRTMSSSLKDLDAVNSEILSQDRNAGGGASHFEVMQ
jgi:hypothetical protein